MLLVRGDLVSFALEGGAVVQVPKHFGLVHDTTGECFSKCKLFVCQYRLGGAGGDIGRGRAATVAGEYFGDTRTCRAGSVAIPRGPWQRIGVVEHVYYARYGSRKGYYEHGFKTTEPRVTLHKQRSGKSLLLDLPDGCIVNWRGFVWP
jgi:hypothetical protein